MSGESPPGRENGGNGGEGGGGGGGCPVNHRSAREPWLKHGRSLAQNDPTATRDHVARERGGESWMQRLWSHLQLASSASSSPPPPSPPPPPPTLRSEPPQSPSQALDTARQVSSIPRAPLSAASAGPTGCPSELSRAAPEPEGASHGARAPPANSEAESGADSATGHWIYPSEKMFFDAMRRKGHAARGDDMRVVVPIHNAVNERAWAEIKEWERPYLAATGCGTPRLHSFSGDSEKMSPKARLNTLLGYQPPFDRHDWVVDRCGTRVEYLIDFYAGRDRAGALAGLRPSFYLDVRPKLNSWEGVRMRVLRAVGWN